MTAPRPTGSRLCVIHGNSLPEGVDPIEGERVTIDAGGALPVEATGGGDIVGIARHGFDRSIPAHLVDHKATSEPPVSSVATGFSPSDRPAVWTRISRSGR